MSIRLRLLLGYGLVLALVALVLGVALGRLHRLSTAGELLVRENARSVVYGSRLIDALDGMDSALLLALAGDTVRAGAQLDSARAAFAGHLRDQQANITERGERAATDAVAEAFAAYATRIDRGDRTLTIYRTDLVPAFARVRAAAMAVRALNLQAMEAKSEAARRSGQRAFWTTLVIGVLALGAGLVAALWLSGVLSRPLREATAAAARIGRGDLDVRLPETAPGELAALAVAMNAMAQQLRDVRDLNVRDLLAEKRKAEAVLDALDDGVVLVDGTRRVAAFNPAAERALGPLRLGQIADEVLPPGALARQVRRALTGAAIDAAEPAVFVTGGADGRPYQGVVSAMAAPTGEGRASEGVSVWPRPGAVVLLRDLTRVRELERMKSSFIMAASHELRTPLTGLEMSLGLLRVDGMAEGDRELVEVAREEGARLGRLVADLLELARAEAGQTRLHRAPFSPADLAEDLRARFAAQAAAQGLALTTDAAAPVDDIDGDVERVGLALSNLVANALRHARAHVHLRVVDAPDAVTFVVDDDGPGIAPNERARVFEPFAQMAGDPAPGGAGLGLALVREFADLHGGHVRVGEAESGGASLSFALPRARPRLESG